VLAGAAIAFAVTERLKLEQSPVTGTRVTKVFSPICRCETRRATIAFRLRKPYRVELNVIDAEGREVRRLLDGARLERGAHEFAWNGRGDDGRLLPEGRYRPKLELDRGARTIVLPNPIRLDVTAPRVNVLGVEPRAFSPDSDGRADGVRVRYRVNERARATLHVNGIARVRSRFRPLRGALSWYGRVEGRTRPPGEYALAVGAADLAGNLARLARAGTVRLRYLELDQATVRARPGAIVRIGVSTDVPSARWTLRRGRRIVESGAARPTGVVLRAPQRPGRYRLSVEAGGYRALALVVVRRA
jgi:hypothetical protein